MSTGQGLKRKLLALERILLEQTDENHPMSTGRLLAELESWGVSAERKSIYRDMEELRRYGLDVQTARGKEGGWFVGERQFQLAELKLLVDAVQSCRFLSHKKSRELIAKLEKLASVHQARQLRRQVYVSDRVKSMNESIYYHVDKLHSAIAGGKCVTFRYFVYNMKKERVYRREGRQYQVSPCGLVWDHENYYLVAWSFQEGEHRHYRVDKMADITVIDRPVDSAHMADMTRYAQRHFGMFAGEAGQVRLECPGSLAGVVLDRFGMDAILVPGAEGRFTVTLDVVVSPQFWGWVFGLGPEVKVLSPAHAVDEYQALLRRALDRQGGD